MTDAPLALPEPWRGALLVTVRDTGQGIQAELRPRVFESRR
jgi:signal transduction histidine kinase